MRSIVLRPGTGPLLKVFIMAAAYLWLWVSLQSEDYALLIGAVGLFLIIAAVMFVTRKVNWCSSEPHPPGRLLTAGARNHQSIRRLIQLSLNPVYPIGAGNDTFLSSNRHELVPGMNHGQQFPDSNRAAVGPA